MTPSDQPMPQMGAGGLPLADPSMSPDAPVSDATMLDLADQIGKQRVGIMATAAPVPNKPYRRKSLEYLRDALNDFAEKFPGAPTVEWEFEERDTVGGKTGWSEPLPEALFVPLLAVTDAIKVINEDGRFDDYIVDPMTVVDDESLRDAASTIATSMRDTDLVEALAAGPGAAPAGEMAEEEMAEEDMGIDFDKFAERM